MKSYRYRESKEKIIPYLLFLPAIVLMIVIIIFPLLYCFYMAVHTYYLPTLFKDPGFLGFEVFNANLNAEFFHSLYLSLMFTVTVLILEFSLGFLFAILLNSDFKGVNILRGIAVVPLSIPPVAGGLFWKMILDPEAGPLNYLLSQLFGAQVKDIRWFSSSNTAFLAALLVDMWQWTPFLTLILLAGIQSVPSDVIESAKIDGASGWRIYKDIIIPYMKLPILIGLIIRIADAFRTFDIIFVTTGGGPGSATMFLPILIYRKAIVQLFVGPAAFYSLILLYIVGAIATVLLRYIWRE